MNDARGFAIILTVVLIAVALAYSGPGCVDLLGSIVFLGILSVSAPLFIGLLHATLPNPAARAGTFMAVALYGLHPSNIHELSNSAGVRLLFAILGMVLAFVLYQRRYAGWLGWTYLIPVAVAALCHQAVLVFAPLLFIFKLLFEGSFSCRTVSLKLALCVPAAVVSLLVFLKPGASPRPVAFSAGGVLPAVITLVSPDYALSGGASSIANVALTAVLSAAILYASVRAETRALAFGLSWFLALLAAAPGHFLPAYIGAALVAAWLISRLLVLVGGARRWLVLASCGILLTACGTAVTQKNGAASPSSNAALAPPSADSLVQPNMSADQWLALSLYAYQNKRYLESIAAAQSALRLKPDDADAYNNIAASYSALHLWDFAIAAAQEALRIKPDYTLARNNLNWALEQKRLASH